MTAPRNELTSESTPETRRAAVDALTFYQIGFTCGDIERVDLPTGEAITQAMLNGFSPCGDGTTFDVVTLAESRVVMRLATIAVCGITSPETRALDDELTRRLRKERKERRGPEWASDDDNDD